MLAVAALVMCGPAWGQAYPSRPIRVVVGFPPGGGVDVLGRALAPKMSESMGQQLVVDNRVGAGGTIASDVVARATPDGHTILIVSASHAVTASMYTKLPYDAVKSFTPITLVASSPNVLLANFEFAARSVSDLLKLARAKPGGINYASGGLGTTGHLSGELLTLQSGVQLTHIPYRGNPLALADLIAGRVQLMFTTVPTALPQLKAGRVRALAVTTMKRFVVLPETPTVAESGLPGYESANWFGALGPRGMPAPIVSRLHKEIVAALTNRDIAEAILRQGAEPMSSTPNEFSAYLNSEVLKWAKTVEKAGIQMNP
jgi:tripartite-type tricarboxylate transporter receptor subunit TctC